MGNWLPCGLTRRESDPFHKEILLALIIPPIPQDILDFELLFHPLLRCYNAILLHGPDGRTP
jgi:hypothetical protein